MNNRIQHNESFVYLWVVYWDFYFITLCFKQHVLSQSSFLQPGYRLDNWGTIPGRGITFFYSPPHLDKLWGPLSLLSNGYKAALSPGVQQLGHEADHSPPSNTKVKNAWSYTSTPTYMSMVWCLVKHGDNFTFTFTHNTEFSLHAWKCH